MAWHHREEDGVMMSAHVDDPPVIGPEWPIRALFDWLGQRIAVKVRGVKHMGMVSYTIPGGYLETTPSRWPR